MRKMIFAPCYIAVYDCTADRLGSSNLGDDEFVLGHSPLEKVCKKAPHLAFEGFGFDGFRIWVLKDGG